MNWSAKAWNAIEGIYKNIIEMPFIKELTEGSLPLEKFQFYITQDSRYLDHFGRALALIGARANDLQDALAFIRFAEGAVVVENALHGSYFEMFGITSAGNIEPACHHYINFLKSTAALDSVEVAMAAVLPCFWIYKKVGDHIYSNQANATNPYRKWIDTYAGEEFGELVNRAIAICDNAAAKCTEAQQQKMTEAFVTASKLEFDFWDAAYRIRKWDT
ncbi:thiaminase II [Pinibacter soli]|uniref:Aminopyrimidine aminohydrolase n=1 Tax=Pinibacter soli TaxID=3044211 RepID=A0ABT6RCV9_9BACT|nr:thiaminase II [Pinibacter soli]MDI3320390.1 thiaminase II [Pinibacter soli]